MKLKKYRVVAAALCAAFLLCGITTTAPGSPPGTAPGGLPVLWLSLLARHPLRLLLSEPFEKAGREVIFCAS